MKVLDSFDFGKNKKRLKLDDHDAALVAILKAALDATTPGKRTALISLLTSDVEAVLAATSVPLGSASPPNTTGVYLLKYNREVVYAGKANGTKGLKDRFGKHISGADSHAIQRALKEDFPDRTKRRTHLKQSVYVQWHEIPDRGRVSAVEAVLIWLLCPRWNKTGTEL